MDNEVDELQVHSYLVTWSRRFGGQRSGQSVCLSSDHIQDDLMTDQDPVSGSPDPECFVEPIEPVTAGITIDR